MVTMKRKGRDRWSWDRQCLAMEDVLVVRAATCWRETAGALTFFFEPQAGAFSKFFEFMTKSTMAKIFHLASHLSRVTPPNKMRKAFGCFAVVESPTNTLSYKPKKE